MQHSRHCLLGNKVILSSDHHSLKWLNPFRRTEETLTRWIETLSECPWYKVHPLSYRWSLIHTHTSYRWSLIHTHTSYRWSLIHTHTEAKLSDYTEPRTSLEGRTTMDVKSWRPTWLQDHLVASGLVLMQCWPHRHEGGSHKTLLSLVSHQNHIINVTFFSDSLREELMFLKCNDC